MDNRWHVINTGWWLSLPPWNIWKSVGMMTFPTYGIIKLFRNHQPVIHVKVILRRALRCDCWGTANIHQESKSCWSSQLSCLSFGWPSHSILPLYIMDHIIYPQNDYLCIFRIPLYPTYPGWTVRNHKIKEKQYISGWWFQPWWHFQLTAKIKFMFQSPPARFPKGRQKKQPTNTVHFPTSRKTSKWISRCCGKYIQGPVDSWPPATHEHYHLVTE